MAQLLRPRRERKSVDASTDVGAAPDPVCAALIGIAAGPAIALLA